MSFSPWPCPGGPQRTTLHAINWSQRALNARSLLRRIIVYTQMDPVTVMKKSKSTLGVFWFLGTPFSLKSTQFSFVFIAKRNYPLCDFS